MPLKKTKLTILGMRKEIITIKLCIKFKDKRHNFISFFGINVCLD